MTTKNTKTTGDKKCPKCYAVSTFPTVLKADREVVCPSCKSITKFSTWVAWDAETNIAQRFSEGKLRFDLIPPEADKMLAEILTMGAKKYADRNWEKGTFNLVKDIIGSLKRHLNLWELGEDFDIESKEHHTKHVLWNAMALAVYIERGMGVDDRPSKK